MLNKLKYFLILLICLQAASVMAQVNPYSSQQQQGYMRDTVKTAPKKLTDEQMMDTLRKKEDHKKDTVVFNSKFVKVTSERLLTDSTQVFALDTGLVNFENYNPLYQPRSPRIGLGITGLPQRSLLYEPAKTVGFDVGQHALDPYMLTTADIQYYRARVAYTNLSLYTGGSAEQIFKVVHSQNIKPNWNVGFVFNTIGSKGYYLRQGVSDINTGVFSWYESKNKRYNILTNILFNTLKAQENGGLVNDNIFVTGTTGLTSSNDAVKLSGTSDAWTSMGVYVKQFYYLGRIDNMRKGSDTSKVLPTNRVSHTFYYNTRKYKFLQNDPDTYRVFPDYYFSSHNSRDSLTIQHLQNEFTYSFYLRGKSSSFVKNELKVDLGLSYDFYHYNQSVLDSVINNFGTKITQAVTKSEGNFQNATLKAKLGYRFSDKAGLDADFQQVAEGYNFGDFLYDVKVNLAGSKRAGRIVLEAYSQSNKAPFVYTNWISNHYIFTGNSFNNQKTTSLSFNYINNQLRLDFKAEYFLINDYLYFEAQPNGIDATPKQASTPISLLKVSLGKNLTWHRWHFDNYVVYQKTDNTSILRTPEVYTYSSLYYAKLLFNVLNSNIGFNVRYNTPYKAPSYAVGLGQFYNGPDVTFTSYPVMSVFAKGTLFRTNLFVQYDYANQGLFSQGFYTVNRYPMFNHQLKFGVSWTFYN
ncbi:putative porin [Mucilaginibacter polytrichastri]|uniref:Porin n=1 Tax=Mucilaginibacter polytrichastri TaxID=1302689 RepID=A0A1Q5ZSI1_9SPHI|nr:putative porin [Mucilaginibacter polytrichastri]OKS84729.1 hypothetical protein RG47T_0162 [Mucilaginibacter polytrichastri]SFT00997.1 Putative porin [Mucilaginibacter polytrichastri]